ncbi:hypothetical protein RchiOBHm_Chr3g0452031 [Rosa chinensis]|uniref:Uncharacterized protein n=1 Tax=Rosa chinensis TaxID=74649 RepID=A0A2P6R664_ROSCH|nr:hypothetical protein RchiOBHm_Chr3g0452031 [Rosa chinensis]
MEEESWNQAPYDIENPYIPLATSITKDLDSLSPLSSECCIYRVPKRLRYVSENAYTPKVVFIGPLHHGKEGLNGMEEQKKRYLQDFQVRTQVSLEDYIKRIKEKEARLRSRYAEPIKLSSDEFVTVILWTPRSSLRSC